MRAQPSVVYKIKDEIAAWCFDRAVVTFGAEVEEDLNSIEDKKNPKAAETKRQRRLERWLGLAPRFRDPAAR